MSYLTKERKEKYEAYLKRENKEPLFGCTLGMFTKEHLPRTTAALPDRELTPEDIDIDAFLLDCDDLYTAHEQMNDDFPFVAAPVVSIPWMEAIMGCPIMCKDNSIWAEPCVEDWESWQAPENLQNNPWLLKLCEIADKLSKHSAGRYPVALTLMRGPADIISAMRGAQNYVWDMIDEPEMMADVADKIADVYIAAAKAQFAAIPEGNEGYICGDQGMRLWRPERFIWLQEDALALLSPEIYRKVIYPADCKIVNEFKHAAFHLHATALWAIDELFKISGLDTIELNLESATIDLEETFAAWKKIRDNRTLVIWAQYEENFESWMSRFLKEIPHSGVNFQIALYDMDPELGKQVRAKYEALLKD